MAEFPEGLLSALLDLIDRLRRETEGFLSEPGDQQLWYNRGYANGMVRVLRVHNHGDRLLDLVDVDPHEYLVGQEFLPWGKAYRHGFEMGEKETREVL